MQIEGFIVHVIDSFLLNLHLEFELCFLGLGIGYLLDRLEQKDEVFFKHLILRIVENLVLLELERLIMESLQLALALL